MQAYIQALDGLRSDELPRGDSQGLAALFVTGLPQGSCDGRRRIMIIGRETRNWNLKSLNPDVSTAEYVDATMRKQEAFFDCVLRKQRQDQGRSFHNFTRRLARTYPNDALVWSNLFCFAWKAGNPLRCNDAGVRERVKLYSSRLLLAQMNVIRPDIVIFAHGVHQKSVAYRERLFPTKGKNAACTDSRYHADSAGKAIPGNQLWSFELLGSMQGHRIHHPSSTAPDAARAQDYLIDTLLRE